MELRHYLRMMTRGWWIISLAALSGIILALANAYVTKPQYRTSLRILISPNISTVDEGQIVYTNTTIQPRVVGTLAELLNSGTFFKEAGAAINIGRPEIFDYKNTAVTVPEANVVELFVDGPDTETTALLANTFAQRMIEYNAQRTPIYTLTVLDPALPPSSPERPKPLRDALLAGILGAVLGAVIVIAQEQIKTPIEALRRRSTIDAVSSAYTRRAFDQKSREVLSQLRVGSLGLIYLDGLQEVLDGMPAPVSQRILRSVKTTLNNELRGNDTVGRWDNTTFALLLPETPERAATSTLTRIVNALSKPIECGMDDMTVSLTPYAGGATYTKENPRSYVQLVEEAEEAVKRSYRSGEKGVSFAASPTI